MCTHTNPLSRPLGLVRCSVAVAALVLLGRAASAQESVTTRTCEEVTIVLRGYIPPPNEEGAAFEIDVTFDANLTAAQEAVIQEAVDDWEGIIKDPGIIPNPYPITFRNGALAAPTIGSHGKFVDDFGMPVSSVITIDNDGSVCWFIDPSPGDDSEFDGGANPCSSASGNCTIDGTTQCTGTSVDLLTVMRHEVGHAMGWTSTPLLTLYTSSFVFDDGRWTIAMDPAGTAHADPAVFPGDLMTPAATNNARTEIALYPDAVLGATHYNRDIVMGFVDADDGGAPYSGTAVEPWPMLLVALVSDTSDEPFLLAPGTYDEAGPTIIEITTKKLLLAANGGSVVIK